MIASDSITKENENYETNGSGSALKYLFALSKYLIKFECRYNKDKNVMAIITLRNDLLRFERESILYHGLEEPEYYRVVFLMQDHIKKLIEKYMPKE